MTMKPWDIEPELKQDRICHVASILMNVRHEAIALHDPDSGDGNWSLGCRIYERTLNTIIREAKKQPWLSFHKENLYFVILINDIPIRFYKGSFDEPTPRTLRRKYPENQLNLPFEDFGVESEWAWRISVDTELDGTVFNISIAQYDEAGRYQNIWSVPLKEPISVISPVDHIKRDAVVLEKPTIRKKSAGTPESDKNAGIE